MDRRKWIDSGSVSVCNQPFERTHCFSVNEAELVIENAEQAKEGHISYKVRLKDGRQGWISGTSIFKLRTEEQHKLMVIQKEEKRAAEKKREARSCEKIGGVSIGMTREQVYASCWGRPQKINNTIAARGTREQLVYPGYSYLYLEDGVLTSIQVSE